MKYLMLGDTHGDIDFAERAMYVAQQEGCQEIIQVGDWAFVWTKTNHIQYLSTLLVRYGVTMRFIDGNHDNHDWLDTLTPSPWGSVHLAQNLIYQPRGSVHQDADGTRFLFLGGAPSIDKAYRTPGKSWWPQETITEEQYNTALNVREPIDVLVTHDALQRPPGFLPKGDPEFRVLGDRSMEMVAGVVDRHLPKLHVHGHWHHSYRRDNAVTRTVGLASNLQTLNQASMIWENK